MVRSTGLMVMSYDCGFIDRIQAARGVYRGLSQMSLGGGGGMVVR